MDEPTPTTNESPRYHVPRMLSAEYYAPSAILLRRQESALWMQQEEAAKVRRQRSRSELRRQGFRSLVTTLIDALTGR